MIRFENHKFVERAKQEEYFSYNHNDIGYPSAKEMYEDFSSGNTAQLKGMKEFIKSKKSILRALQSQNIYEFAKEYNGPKNASSYKDKIVKAKGTYEKA